ncbi:QueT transporter family protein [bacterium]|nr:QueT transporter family protein [bacterium]
MVVLVAVSAACYVAVLIPFKIAVIVPGLTEARPGAAVPVLFSFLFGPAGAFGAAFGNLIGDILGGMFGPGSIPGFVGNFVYGFVPYAAWRALAGASPPGARGAIDWLLAGGIVVLACLSIATIIGWGADLLGLAPFAALGNIIFLNNLLASVALALPGIALTHRRVERAGLLWHEILDNTDTGRGRFRYLGLALLIAGSVGGFATGNVISLGALGADFGAAGFAGPSGTAAVGAGVAPFVALILAGCALL